MRNLFNGDEDKFNFDNENEEDGEHEQEFEVNIDTDILGAMELDLAEINLSHQLLDRAVALAKQDLWWWFRRPAVKMRRVERIYRRLEYLTRTSGE